VTLHHPAFVDRDVSRAPMRRAALITACVASIVVSSPRVAASQTVRGRQASDAETPGSMHRAPRVERPAPPSPGTPWPARVAAGFGVGLLTAGAVGGLTVAIASTDCHSSAILGCSGYTIAGGIVGAILLPLTSVVVVAVGDALGGNGRFSTSLAGTAAGAILGLLSLWITPALSDESADLVVGLSVFSALTAGGTVIAYELSSRANPRDATAARRVPALAVAPLRDGPMLLLGGRF
jgi:hypothetical protein